MAPLTTVSLLPFQALVAKEVTAHSISPFHAASTVAPTGSYSLPLPPSPGSVGPAAKNGEHGALQANYVVRDCKIKSNFGD